MFPATASNTDWPSDLTFMVAYGMKPADALAKLGLSEAEAQRIATAHRDRYPLLHEALSCNS